MMHTVSKHRKYINFTILFFLSLAILNTILCIVSRTYEEFVNFIFANSYKPYAETLLPNKNIALFYTFFKILLFFVLAWLGSVWIDFFSFKKKSVNHFINTISNTLYISFQKNRSFIKNLDNDIKTAFFLITLSFFVVLSIFLIKTPIDYDELHSYRYFSSKGIWTSISYYPLPNNHVFYNIIAVFFINLPVDIEVSLRIPALISSILAVYYFFKICHHQFGGTISIVIICFIMSLYSFELFSFSARGYAFINLFCVLLLYSSHELHNNPLSKKYRWLFISCSVLGVLSVPSFIYFLFPLYCTILFVNLRKKNSTVLFSFIKDCFITGGLILTSYGFILLLNNPEGLTNPNGGSTKFSISDPSATFLIKEHLKNVSGYIFGREKALAFTIICTFLCLLYNFKRKSGGHLFQIILSFFVLVSPLIILLIHQVIPFYRTWIYLIFPFSICMAFVMKTAYTALPNSLTIKLKNLKIYLILLSFPGMLFSLMQFEYTHQRHASLNYEFNAVRTKYLDHELRNINQIGQTQKGMEFYPAELIYNLCYKLDQKRDVRLSPIDTITNQDVLIIDKSEIARFKNQLSNYHLLSEFNEGFSIFYKNK